MKRTIEQVLQQYEAYFQQTRPTITPQRSGNELRVRYRQMDTVIRRAAATPNRSQGRLR
jgi:hypothetical protein